MYRIFKQPLDDVVACLEPIVTVRNPARALVPLFASLVVCWVVYVPIHELLHAYGCMWAGGSVTKLEISARYGGNIVGQWFPFVVSASDYAGRLSGFDTKGSDTIYMITVFMPYVITLFLGVPLIKLAGRRRRPLLFGLAIVTALAPFYSLPGDYFEMGSILVTRAVTLLRGWSGAPAYEKLRSDDVFKLLETYVTNPEELQLTGAGTMIGGAGVILLSGATALLLAFATYWVGHVFSRLVLGKPKPASPT